MSEPYYRDDHVTLYHGDMLEVLPSLDVRADAVITDPPYGETSLAWDRWPDGWVRALGDVTNSLWCFGSMRMFFRNLRDFDEWKLAQEIVWEKNVGTGLHVDRFKRVHEFAVHWYRGPWSDIHHDGLREPHGNRVRRTAVRRRTTGAHIGERGPHDWEDDGTRMVRSVFRVQNLRGKAFHPTQKPTAILDPLIRYSVPPGGLVLDPFAGSASTLLTARSLGRRAVGIEADERYCQLAAERLAVPDLFGGVA